MRRHGEAGDDGDDDGDDEERRCAIVVRQGDYSEPLGAPLFLQPRL
jgi:hypothetical protein